MSLTRPSVAAIPVFIALVLCLPHSGWTSVVMDITAYEYRQKFHTTMELGACPLREVSIKLPNDTMVTEVQRCTLQKPGRKVHTVRNTRSVENVLLSHPKDVMKYLTPCAGDVATHLGILYSGDCLAVEIASRLTFDNKTVVRAFVEDYTKSVDIWDSANENFREGMEMYFKDKYYLKMRSYGMLEIIFVEMRFRYRRHAKEARKLQLAKDSKMSDYMLKIAEDIGEPKFVTTIHFSTTQEGKVKPKKFKEWQRALREVQISESMIKRTRSVIDAGKGSSHLKYTLYPFIMPEKLSSRTLVPEVTASWKAMAILEVNLRHCYTTAKRAIKKCSGSEPTLCIRLFAMGKKLRRTRRNLHKSRSNWANFTPQEEQHHIKKFTNTARTLCRITNEQAYRFHKKRMALKREKRNRKRKSKNQTNRRRIRHSRLRETIVTVTKKSNNNWLKQIAAQIVSRRNKIGLHK